MIWMIWNGRTWLTPVFETLEAANIYIKAMQLKNCTAKKKIIMTSNAVREVYRTGWFKRRVQDGTILQG